MMAEVISASELRPSTIYQYFANKDEIVWAILGEVLEDAAARAKKSIEGAATGLARITALLEYMADDLTNNQSKIRFMAQFDAMYARDWPAERLLTLEGQFHDQGFKAFRKLIRDGIADGSLRSDLDPDLTLHAVINAVIAAQRRLASLRQEGRGGIRTTDRPALPGNDPHHPVWPARQRACNEHRAVPASKNSQGHNQKEVLVKSHLRMIAMCTLFLSLAPVSLKAAESNGPRLMLAADSGWKFMLGDPNGAEVSSFADTAWRTVDLPHDWSIEGRPDKDNPSAGGGGFFPAGVGWYRKTFSAPADWQGKRVSVEFDGVYKDATVYLNGHKLGTHPYGYTSFTFDLTEDLNWAGPNVLAVRVDNSAQPNSRWYSGSGIYRHVRVVVTDPTHVAHWGVFVTSPKVSEDSATVSIQTKVANESAKPTEVTVETTLYDRAGQEAGTTKSALTIAPGKDAEASQTITVTRPALWSPASPSLVPRGFQNSPGWQSDRRSCDARSESARSPGLPRRACS